VPVHLLASSQCRQRPCRMTHLLAEQPEKASEAPGWGDSHPPPAPLPLLPAGQHRQRQGLRTCSSSRATRLVQRNICINYLCMPVRSADSTTPATATAALAGCGSCGLENAADVPYQ
jgi:hypothetical protein